MSRRAGASTSRPTTPARPPRWRRPPLRACSQENRDLSAAELRALLALTADVPAVVDGGRGLGAGAFDARDRLGHSFKIGHGVVNARAACLAAADPICLALLATRPVPDAGAANRGALALAQAWRVEVLGAAARRRTRCARDYAAPGPAA